MQVTSARPEANRPAKRRLLVGEKNPDLRDLLVAILRADDHDVIVAGSSVDLLDALAVSLHPQCGSGEFDLVIADDRLLGKADLDTFAAIARRAKVPPLVFTTAFANLEIEAKAGQFGAVATLEKPIDVDRLRDVVERFSRGSVRQASQAA